MTADIIKKSTLEDIIAQAVDFSTEEPFNPAFRPDPDSVPDLDFKLAKQPANDLGNAMRLLSRGGEDLIWIQESGWLGWDGKKWSLPDGAALAVKRAHETVRAMVGEVRAIQAEGNYPNESDDDFEKRVKRFHNFRIKSGDLPRVRGMLDSAAVYRERRIHDMDDKPMLFNCQTGTLQLDAKPDDESKDCVRMVEHQREHYITKLGDVEYKQDATCPHFMKFLNDILPNQDIQNFLQVWFGYTLSGLLREQYVVMFYGGGSNGKSTLMDLLNTVFGDYALTLPFASLLKDDKKRGAEATPDLARLPGARFVTAAEPETGSQFSESAIKQLTGGEKITARHLNRGFFEFHPQFKMVLSFNNKPQIRGQDEGIWRRVLLVPFEQKFVTEDKLAENPEAKLKDPELMPRLKAECSGVLNWMLDGWRIYNEKGLIIPDVVKAATNEYRQESNPVGEFLTAWTVPCSKDTRILSSRLYKAYQEYCKIDGLKPWTPKTFGDRLTDLGIKRTKSSYTFYMGIQLSAEAEKIIDGGNSMPNYDPD